jgi:hypothetical protein
MTKICRDCGKDYTPPRARPGGGRCNRCHVRSQPIQERVCLDCERTFKTTPSQGARSRCGTCRQKRKPRRIKSCVVCSRIFIPTANAPGYGRCPTCRSKHPLTMLRQKLRTRLNMAVRSNARAGSAVRDLGCTISAFRDYIETLFWTGMSWNNYGKWHLDHIRPLASFDLTNREQFLAACHFTNIQPLWARDNSRKGRLISTNY